MVTNLVPLQMMESLDHIFTTIYLISMRKIIQEYLMMKWKRLAVSLKTVTVL